MSKYSVKLNREQRQQLEELVKKGEAPARKIQHAHILLKSDQGEWGPRWSDKRIQEAFGVGETLIKRFRKRFIENGLEDAINRRKQPERVDARKNRWGARSPNHCHDVYGATGRARILDIAGNCRKGCGIRNC